MAQFINDIESNIIFANQLFNGSDLVFTYAENERPVKVGIVMVGDDCTMIHGTTFGEHFNSAHHNFGESGRIELGGDTSGSGSSDNGASSVCLSLKNKIVMSRNLDDEIPLWCEVATVDDIPPLRTFVVTKRTVYSEVYCYQIDCDNKYPGPSWHQM